MSRVPSLRVGVSLVAAHLALSAAAAPAGAVQTSTLTYQCKYPLIGVKGLTVKLSLDIPETWPSSVPTAPFGVVSEASAADMAAGLQAVDDLTSIKGTSTAFATVKTAQGFDVPAKTIVTIPETFLPNPVPDPLVLLATGSTPALTFDDPGVEDIYLDKLAINLTALNSAGDPIPLPPVTKDIDGNKVADSDGDANTFDVYCKLTPDTQSTKIGSFEIVSPGGTPTPMPTPMPTPTRTPSATPTPAPTTTPTPRPTGTPAPTPTPPPTPNATPTPTPGPTPPPQDKTPPTRPGAVDLSDDDIGTTFLNLRWRSSTDSGSGVREYWIYVNGTFSERVAAGRTSFKLTGLRPDRTYAITIRAVDNADNLSDPLKYSLRTRAEIDAGPGPGPSPTPVIIDPGPVNPTSAAKVRTVTFSGRLDRPSRSNKRAFVVLARKPALAKTPVLRVVLSKPAPLRISLAQRRDGGVYKTIRGAVAVGADDATMYLKPTGSWNGRIIPQGVYRIRVSLASGDSDDLVLRFR